jgi:hypothetical protein
VYLQILQIGIPFVNPFLKITCLTKEQQKTTTISRVDDLNILHITHDLKVIYIKI